MNEVLGFLACGFRERIARMGTFGLAGLGLAFYSDITGAHKDTVWSRGLLLTGFSLLAIAAVWFIGRGHRPLTVVEATASRRATRAEPPLPNTLHVSRDLALFGIITALQLFLTGVGQHWVGPSANAADAQPVSVFATLVPELEKLRMQMATLKRETSDDPRKELANLGVLWTADAFYDAIRQGDRRTVDLFVAGGMSTATSDSHGRSLPIVLALNDTSAAEMIDALVASGLDVNHVYAFTGVVGSKQKMTLLSRAIEKNNMPLVEALVRHHVRVDEPIQTFGMMGLPRDTYPLASAVHWMHLEIAEALLKAGANPGVGDFTAFREAQALKEKTHLDPATAASLEQLLVRLAPQGDAGTRVQKELRLQAVDQELTKVALEGFRWPRGTSEKAAADRRYDDLQEERARLKKELAGAH